MDFCPECKTKMIPLKKKQARTVTLILSCPKCGNEKKYTRPNSPIIKVRNHPPEKLVIIGKKEQQLKTTPRFIIECPKCGNKRAYGWIVHLGSLEQSSTQFYRCTKCNYTFRDTS
ncbi:MAG: RPA12/RPB9/RPC11 RNA polymerase family protein [Candidatus Bathyarchaeota archaeon]|nr:RPA12/RPB9/RPC11 RNA polymerase family protein [Candidatus Bathyarchaeota archaeon]